MSLSPEVQQRLDKAREKQFINPRNKNTLQTIANRAFVGLIGPSKSGKTALSLAAIQIDPEHFYYVPSTTNRKVRDDEPAGTIRPVENTDEQMTKILDDMAQGDLVQYAIHPTDGAFYGTYPQDYQADKYNLMPLLAGPAANYLLGSPFRETKAIGIITDPVTLKQRVQEAYQDQPQTLANRLTEGIDSAKFLLTQHKLGRVSLLHNIDGAIEESAQSLIDTIYGSEQSDAGAIAHLERTIPVFEDMLAKLPTNGEEND